MRDLFVIGDIYGHKEKLEKLLTYWKVDAEQLVCLGNFMGRGERSLETIRLIQELHLKYGAHVLGGSQEDMFLTWLGNPALNPLGYYHAGGREILTSFFGESITQRLTPESIAEKIVHEHYDILPFVINLPNYIEHDDYLIVPGGVRLIENWKVTTVKHYKYGDESMQYGENKTGKIVIFGTIPTKDLHRKKTDEVWISACKTKIGLNGNVDHYGKSHAMQISNGKYQFYSA